MNEQIQPGKLTNYLSEPKHRPWIVGLGCCPLAASVAQAQQPCIETEPNDTPEGATEFRAPTALMGDMPDGDQDAWLWTVSDADSLAFGAQGADGAAQTTNTDAYRLMFRSDDPVPASSGPSATSQDAATALIVLVTDGEETCDGDPAAVIAELRASGIDVSLNIVGFAIDDRELADEFSAWAAAGGGRYFAASDTESLASSVADALATTFAVYDAQDNRVTTGRVGGEVIELQRGTYRVVLETVPRRTLSAEIHPDQTTELSAESRQ